MNNLAEGLEKITKSLIQIKNTDSLEDAKYYAEKSLGRIAVMSAGDEINQRKLKELFKG